MIYYYNRNPVGIHVPSGAVKLNPGHVNRKAHYLIGGVEHKHCNHCDSWKTLSNFYKHCRHWDGLDTNCSVCEQAMRRNSVRYLPI